MEMHNLAEVYSKLTEAFALGRLNEIKALTDSLSAIAPAAAREAVVFQLMALDFPRAAGLYSKTSEPESPLSLEEQPADLGRELEVASIIEVIQSIPGHQGAAEFVFTRLRERAIRVRRISLSLLTVFNAPEEPLTVYTVEVEQARQVADLTRDLERARLDLNIDPRLHIEFNAPDIVEAAPEVYVHQKGLSLDLTGFQRSPACLGN